ncbi:MAG: hypothetical protein ACXADC_11135 [Candidatus Thorarchaeota archaeon]
MMNFLAEKLTLADSKEFLIADFASGENDKIPNFFHRVLPDFLPEIHTSKRRIVTYSTDLHGLRLDSLFSLFEEQQISNHARAVHTRLERMVIDAAFRQEQIDYLKEQRSAWTTLDKRILEEKRIGTAIFDLGILNNDIIGYLFEYYKAYTDALTSLEAVQKTIRPGGLLIVTQPCSLYPVDNLEVLRQVGFSFIEGIDVVLNSGNVTPIKESAELHTLSKMGHYTFFVLKKD